MKEMFPDTDVWRTFFRDTLATNSSRKKKIVGVVSSASTAWIAFQLQTSKQVNKPEVQWSDVQKRVILLLFFSIPKAVYIGGWYTKLFTDLSNLFLLQHIERFLLENDFCNILNI